VGRSRREPFVWIVGHEDFERADEAYSDSPERLAVDPDSARQVAGAQTRLMDPAPRPRTDA
jgi:hypothetical protein